MKEHRSRRIPYNDSYPSCERAVARLLIYTGESDPGQVSQRLGLDPTRVVREGVFEITGLDRKRVPKINGWFLSSEDQGISSLDIRRHLDWLLDLLEPRAGELEALQEMCGVEMGIDCVWWSKSGHGGPTLWPEQMQRMASLNLECSFDVYFFGEEE